MYVSKYKGILFIEGSPPNAENFGEISIKLKSFLSQEKSLDDVKDQMCQIVLSKGGNSVINFKYGQKSTFWQDKVFWYGSGEIALVNPDDYPDHN